MVQEPIDRIHQFSRNRDNILFTMILSKQLHIQILYCENQDLYHLTITQQMFVNDLSLSKYFQELPELYHEISQNFEGVVIEQHGFIAFEMVLGKTRRHVINLQAAKKQRRSKAELQTERKFSLLSEEVEFLKRTSQAQANQILDLRKLIFELRENLMVQNQTIDELKSHWNKKQEPKQPSGMKQEERKDVLKLNPRLMQAPFNCRILDLTPHLFHKDNHGFKVEGDLLRKDLNNTVWTNFILAAEITQNRIYTIKIQVVRSPKCQIALGVLSDGLFGRSNTKQSEEMITYDMGKGVVWSGGIEEQVQGRAEAGDMVTMKVDLIENRIQYFLQKAKRSFTVQLIWSEQIQEDLFLKNIYFTISICKPLDTVRIIDD